MAQVPRMALTVGVGTVFGAREVCIIATGAAKSEAVRQGVEGHIGHEWTITKLQDHPRWLMVVDEEACSELKVKTVKVCCFLGAGKWTNMDQYFKDIEGVAASMGFNAAGLEEDKQPWETKAAKL
jgi:glucosamine-6-phosphate deaminase